MTYGPTIPDWKLYSWESQVTQFPKVGPAGITHHVYCACGKPRCVKGIESCGAIPVDTWLYRNRKGHVVGILYRYSTYSDFERPGNVNIWVRPDRQRRGIGRALVAACERRFGPMNLDQQRFTTAGAAFAEKLRGEREKG